MGFVKGKGAIWPEYWIDCCRCDHHQPLATSKSPAVAAKKQGWRRDPTKPIDGPWICPQCQEEAAEIAQVRESTAALKAGHPAEVRKDDKR